MLLVGLWFLLQHLNLGLSVEKTFMIRTQTGTGSFPSVFKAVASAIYTLSNILADSSIVTSAFAIDQNLPLQRNRRTPPIVPVIIKPGFYSAGLDISSAEALRQPCP